MTTSYYADRLNLYRLQQLHPEWAPAQLATACGRSLAWAQKWRQRFRSELVAGKTLHEVAQGHSCARKHPPARPDPLIVERILQIRDHPPEGLHRAPGPKAILYYLPRSADLWTASLPLPRSSRTIYTILKQNQRIAERSSIDRQPMERPEPLSSWQIDLKDISTVQPSASGKQQHVVETLNIVDMGTSLLVDAHVRPDFTAQTALESLAQTLLTVGRPKQITLDRDPRWVGSPEGSDFPSALLRFAACLGIDVHVCDPHHPQQNGFVERSNRTYSQECLQVHRPGTLSEACEVTATFEHHYNFQRPNQALSCGNVPPRTAFPTLPPLPAVPAMVDPDGWLTGLQGFHLERKVDRTGCVKLDLKHYYISSKLRGHRVTLQVDAAARCLHIYQEAHLLKSVALKGLVGRFLSFEQFVELMAQQARAQAVLRTTQERRRRTAETVPL